MITRNSDL